MVKQRELAEARANRVAVAIGGRPGDGADPRLQVAQQVGHAQRERADDRECETIEAALLPSSWELSGAGGARLRLDRPPAICVGEPLTALAIVRRGVGVTLLPELLVEARSRAGELRRLLPSWRGAELELFAVMPPGRPSVAAVRAFLDHLVVWIAEARVNPGGGGP